MARVSLIHTILYGAGAFLSLLTWALAAGLVAKFHADFTYVGGNFNAANAVLAWGLMSMIYYIAALVILLFVSSTFVLVSVLVDVVALGFFVIFGLGSAGSLSTVASWFTFWSDAGFDLGGIGNATIAFAWLLVVLQLGTLIWEVAYTLMHWGGSLDVWRQSFHDLTEGGGVGAGVAAGSGGGGGFGGFGRRNREKPVLAEETTPAPAAGGAPGAGDVPAPIPVQSAHQEV